MNSVTDRPKAGTLPMRILTRERTLLLLFGLYMVGCFLLLVYLRDASRASVESAALAQARVAAAFIIRQGASGEPQAIDGIHLRRLSAIDDLAELPAGTAELARQRAGTLVHRLRTGGKELAFEAALADGRGGTWLLQVPIGPELRAMQVKFERFYMIAALLGTLVLGLLGAGAMHLGRIRRDLNQGGSARIRATAAAVGPNDDAASERMRLYAIVLLSFAIFCADAFVPLGASVGVAYIIIVLVSLGSRNERHTWMAVVLGTVLTVARLFFDAHESELMWISMANRTMSIFAIWTVALLGLSQKRTIRAQLLARGEATEAQASNLALKAALERTEAAEAELRRGQRLIDDVARMARIGDWAFDVKAMTPIWSPEVFRIHEVDPSDPPTLERAVNYFAPEARSEIRRVMQASIKEGTPFDVTLPLITATGKRLWVRALGGAEREKNGTIVRISGAFQDVTEQYEVRGRLERAITGSSDALFDWDLTREGPVWYSPRLREMLGYAPDEPFPWSVRELMTPEERTRV